MMLCKNLYPENYFVLFAFTGQEAFFVGYVCTIFGVAHPWIVYEAFILTGAIFGALVLFTIQSRYPLEMFGGSLYAAMVALIVVSCMQNFLFPDASIAYARNLGVGIVIFCGYVIYDVSMICQKLGYDDYIVAALELYLDIINLFLRILHVLACMSGRD